MCLLSHIWLMFNLLIIINMHALALAWPWACSRVVNSSSLAITLTTRCFSLAHPKFLGLLKNASQRLLVILWLASPKRIFRMSAQNSS